MKKTLNSAILILLSLVFVFCLVSCNTDKIDTTGLWESATYLKDTTLGDGAKTVTFEVEAGDQSVSFTIHTDKEILGDALLEHKLIAGDESQYGLYVKVVNGIKADYDVDQSWWNLLVNGEASMTGVDGIEISDDASYKFVYSK